jgi:hypothetical protein
MIRAPDYAPLNKGLLEAPVPLTVSYRKIGGFLLGVL